MRIGVASAAALRGHPHLAGNESAGSGRRVSRRKGVRAELEVVRFRDLFTVARWWLLVLGVTGKQ